MEDNYMSLNFVKNFINNELDEYEKNSVENSKENYRNLHETKRKEFERSLKKIDSNHFTFALDRFALGKEVDPEKIEPELVEVKTRKESDLFRIATSFWSVPPSPGYGRRIRFLVFDKQNNMLIGVFALGDPVIALSTRDKWIGWNQKQRFKRISSILDGYVVGAVPPYNFLLGGKLVTSLIASKKVSEIFDKKYAKKESEYKKINSGSGELSQGLALVTISSALGRSSIYNRIKLPGILELHKTGNAEGNSSGFSKGHGHFHFSEKSYQLINEYLNSNHSKELNSNRFGDGSNYKMRVLREFFKIAGIENSRLKHGIKRECFGMPLAENFREYLTLKSNKLIKKIHSTEEISKYAINRWIIPRSKRIKENKDLFDYREWTEIELLKKLSWYGGSFNLFR